MTESRLPQRCGYFRLEGGKTDILFISNILWKEEETELSMVSDDEKSKEHFMSCLAGVNRSSH